MEELRAAVEGRHAGLRRVLVAADDPSSLWQTLGVTPARTTQTASLARVLTAVRSSKRVLGLVPAAAVRPTVRALPVDGRSLFGRGHLTDLGSWPLLAAPGAAAVPRPFDPARHVDPRGRGRRHARPRGLPPGRHPGQGRPVIPGTAASPRSSRAPAARSTAATPSRRGLAARVAPCARSCLGPTSRSSITRARRPMTSPTTRAGSSSPSTLRSSRASPVPASIS